MKALIIFLLACYFALSYRHLSAQSAGYTIESFQGVYTELEDYESVGILALGSPIWEMEFDFNFQFPFYGALYDKMIYNAEGWGMFTDDEDESTYLMDYTGSYAWDDLNDTSNITSDVRFSHVTFNNMQAFVLQYTKMGFFADPVANSFDTYMNFQIWFFENGVMEVHFGEMHMDGTPIYEPGKGFYCYTTSGGVDTNEVCGPHVGISNPYDRDDGIAVSGSYDDFEITSDIYDNLTTLPPPGWIIRFKPTSVGLFDPAPQNNHIIIAPNPASSYILIPNVASKVLIYADSGKIVYEGVPSEKILSVSNLTPGIYFTKIISSGQTFMGRFIKI
ncbi:MAG: T9SS type A sorting domain-containing protein [Saprospiraceae bacterium]|uniref:T9SS type A sorting domain-containing protein n=1 Tax=Candidatus Opimibacter skivensis TaxID=2982028 RepID=A0A9D7SZY0_9BACT|nr:T9SS type A sorting domain-containing protein [Candidatus Opimibacter skivensis]